MSAGAFTADGRWLITSQYDTITVRAWRLAIDDLMRRACRTAARNLTQAEWELYLPGQAYMKTCPEFP